MGNFCKNCGSELKDEDIFCGNCGQKSDAVSKEASTYANVAFEQVSSESASADGGKKNYKKRTAILIGGIAVAAAAIAGIILLFSSVFGGSGAQKALDNYAKALQNPTIKNAEKLAPDEYWNARAEDDYNDADEVLEAHVEALKIMREPIEDICGDNVRISFKVEKEKDVEASTLNAAKDLLKEYYNIQKKDIKKMVELQIIIKIQGSEDEDERKCPSYAIQIGNNWYVCNRNGFLMIP